MIEGWAIVRPVLNSRLYWLTMKITFTRSAAVLLTIVLASTLANGRWSVAQEVASAAADDSAQNPPADPPAPAFDESNRER